MEKGQGMGKEGVKRKQSSTETNKSVKSSSLCSCTLHLQTTSFMFLELVSPRFFLCTDTEAANQGMGPLHKWDKIPMYIFCEYSHLHGS